MRIDFDGAKLYVRPGSTDLRKGVAGLLAIIENEMHLNALSNSVFFFCNKNHKLLKIIFWNKTGFWLAQKRLEQATLSWQNTTQEAGEIKPVTIEVIKDLYEPDFIYLQLLYRQLNGESGSSITTRCPSCGAISEVKLAELYSDMSIYNK